MRAKLVPWVALASLLALPVPAAAEHDLTAQITARFWWWTPETAQAAGFTTDGRCVDRPGVGAMGVHYTKAPHVDGAFNALEPEAVVFDPFTRKAVAVEYISTARNAPTAFGHTFEPFPPIRGAWALHLWLVGNPLGQFSSWNPLLTCTRDPARETVLLGEAKLPDLHIKLEVEPAKPMNMLMGGRWTEMPHTPSDRFHIEVKPEDPQSRTRLPYAQVTFRAVNQDTGHRVEGELHPMWGSSGLHYAMNGDLPDGAYQATVTVGVPTFMRAPVDRERWMSPARAHYVFTMRDGLVFSAGVAGDGDAMEEMPPSEMPPGGMPGGMDMVGHGG